MMNPFEAFRFTTGGRAPPPLDASAPPVRASPRSKRGLEPAGPAGDSLPAAGAGAPLTTSPAGDGTPPKRPPARAKQQPAPPLAKGGAPGEPGEGEPPLPPGGVPEKLGDAPLRLIIVGHNPSAHAWASGHFYSNSSNRMWPLLISTGIAPPGIRGAVDDDLMPSRAGVGFTDIGTGTPGTDSSTFSSEYIRTRWLPSFYSRLAAHLKRASDSIGCVCGRCGAPCIVAFSGKRQYLELLNAGPPPPAALPSPFALPPQAAPAPAAGVEGKRSGGNAGSGSSSSSIGGRQGAGKRPKRVATVDLGRQAGPPPPGWPLPPSTEIWVLTSTSGASALTNEVRAAPYEALAARLRGIPWPRPAAPSCVAAAAGGATAAAAGPGAEAGAADAPAGAVEGRG